MAGAWHRGRRNKKAHVGTLLLLMCMYIPALTLQDAEKKECPHGDYLTEEGICCNKCSPGFKLVEKCHAAGQRSSCTSCPAGQYTDEMNFFPNCRRCRFCKKSKNEIEDSPCQKNQNTICRCEDGYYKYKIDSETYECRKCVKCGPDEKEKQACSQTKNTVCGCKENYLRVNDNCEPCKNCTAECKQYCSSLPTLNTKAPDAVNNLLINVIAGASAVVFVLLVLVASITYLATKRFTNQQLNTSSQPSDDSPDSCKQVLINNDEPSENSSVTAIPQSPVNTQELSKLPDCVPLEIKIPELIYIVLDQVPVPQVKQLVRSLGVKDTEIEQAEMDHRSCREAHYQMLRVWIERGSPAGGRGQGGMLHRPLLQELLDKLRDMHLGRTAEELETKYSIQ